MPMTTAGVVALALVPLWVERELPAPAVGVAVAQIAEWP